MTNTLQITPRDFMQRLDSGELWRILDVRKPWEPDIAALGETQNIPMAKVPGRYDELSDGTAIAGGILYLTGLVI